MINYPDQSPEREALLRAYALTAQNPVVTPEFRAALDMANARAKHLNQFFYGMSGEPESWRQVFRGGGE